MNIEPPSIHPREISVTEPVSLAYARVKLMLFQPFDLGKWFVIGFCAWLAGLGESGGGGGGFNFNNSFANKNVQPWDQLRHLYGVARDFVLANMVWVLPVAGVAALIMLGLGLLILWLNCRGKFMFLHCVARNRAEIVLPWDTCGGLANSLFWFRLVLSLVGMVAVLPFVIGLIVLIVRMVAAGEVNPPLILGAVALGLGVLFLLVLLGLIHKFLGDFVVPIMYLRGTTCMAAGREFLGLLSAQAGWFILYILFQIVLAMVLGMLVAFIFLLTCCVACCLAMLPYIGTVVLLPIIVFKRAYSAYFLAQFGPSYDVFPLEAPPVATAPPPGLQPLGPQ